MGDKVVLSYHNSLLRKSDVDLLSGPHWLNDQLIGFWLEYLENKPELVNDSICLLSPEVVQLIKLGTQDDSSMLLESLNINSKKLIVLPVNDSTSVDQPGGTHWSLLVYDCLKKQFYHLDSMGGGNYHHAKKIARNMNLVSTTEIIELECTQQRNSWDCGVFVCCHVEHLVSHCLFNQDVGSIPPVSQKVVNQYRTLMLDVIRRLSSG